MTYKPTFKPSPQKRPWYRRLTPLAWALIGVAALVLLLACVGGGIALTDRTDEGPWNPTPALSTIEGPTASPVPTDTPVPTTGPSPTPTEWWEGMMSPTPEPTPAFPAWWADEMIEGEDGHLHPPQEVDDAVWEAFIGGLGCWKIADREMVPEESFEELIRQATQYLADDPEVWRAACSLESVEEILAQRPALGLVEFGPRSPVVCDERPDRCISAVAAHSKGAVIFEEEACQAGGDNDIPCIRRPPLYSDQYPHRFYMATLEYDGGSGIWKIVSLEMRVLPEE